jgi:flagellar biosynthesis anti-sigma factor FlgM
MKISEGDHRTKYDPSIKKVGDKTNTGNVDKKQDLPQLSDDVNLSKESQIITNVRRSMEDLPVIRLDKVRPIDQAVKDGTYEIKDNDVADKIVEETLKDELL